MKSINVFARDVINPDDLVYLNLLNSLVITVPKTYFPNNLFIGTLLMGWSTCLFAYSNTATLVISVVSSGIPTELAVSDTTITTVTDVCFDAQNEITMAGSSDVIVEADASANFIAGTSIRFLPGFHAEAGSYVHGWITTDGSFCDAVAAAISVVYQPEEKSLKIEESEKNEVGDVITAKVYPNPGNGQFHVVLSGAGEGSSTIYVCNLQGVKVYSGVISNQLVNDVLLKSIPSGLYLIEIFSGNKTLLKKLVVR